MIFVQYIYTQQTQDGKTIYIRNKTGTDKSPRRCCVVRSVSCLGYNQQKAPDVFGAFCFLSLGSARDDQQKLRVTKNVNSKQKSKMYYRLTISNQQNHQRDFRKELAWDRCKRQ